jgi:hypothetical protein
MLARRTHSVVNLMFTSARSCSYVVLNACVGFDNGLRIFYISLIENPLVAGEPDSISYSRDMS